jgi:hypothetical protein
LQYFSRLEMFAIVCALGLLVVGVSLIAVPPDAPLGSRTKVDGVFAVASPSPSPAARRAPDPGPSPSPQPSPTATAAPVSMSGPSHIAPWTRAVYRVTFSGSGSRAVEVWWTGAAMGDWTWQRIEGHCELTPSRDRLSGTALDHVVVELELTPSGAPGGQLVFFGRDAGGQTYTLGTATVS